MSRLKLFILILLLAGIVARAADSTNFPARFVMDMVHNNPGEPLQPSAFRNPNRTPLSFICLRQ
jgi:hypothetical protein